MGVELFAVPVAMIFAREFLEAGIILTNFRTVVQRMESWDEEKKAVMMKVVYQGAAAACAVALVMLIILGAVLGAVGKKMDNAVAELVEGASKLVASICIAQFSLKIPKWLGIYTSNKHKDAEAEAEAWLSPKSVFFNVSWNIWREMAEIGVFLIPYFLDDEMEKVPVSAVVGLLIAAVLGVLIYIANEKLENKNHLAFWMAGLMGLLAVGLFTGGCHEFEEVLGETDHIFSFGFDCPPLKIFGFAQSPTLLTTIAWWFFAIVLCALHMYKYSESRKMAEATVEYEPEAKTAPNNV
mmetsp:Transcript_47853/g.91486  ORF Transcript_47853/g.91486 Transcript_47853/m.91486 type:complete len:296 (-) Transcript_47853:185-1072(-)